MTEEKYLTPADIAARLQVSRSRAYEIARELPRLKFGNCLRIAESVFQAWVDKKTLTPAAERPPAPAIAWSPTTKPRKPHVIGRPRRPPPPPDDGRPRIRLTRQPT